MTTRNSQSLQALINQYKNQISINGILIKTLSLGTLQRNSKTANPTTIPTTIVHTHNVVIAIVVIIIMIC